MAAGALPTKPHYQTHLRGTIRTIVRILLRAPGAPGVFEKAVATTEEPAKPKTSDDRDLAEWTWAPPASNNHPQRCQDGWHWIQHTLDQKHYKLPRNSALWQPGATLCLQRLLTGESCPSSVPHLCSNALSGVLSSEPSTLVSNFSTIVSTTWKKNTSYCSC